MDNDKKYHACFNKQFLHNLILRKNPDAFIQQAKNNGLQKTLTAIDLIILGVGAIIGSGIFAVVGIAAAGGNETLGAGPALVLSMVIAAVACIFSAFCYSEFSTMIPVAGGAYTYTFATLGEFAAWMIGWILMLEYAVGYIAVACAWSNHFMQFIKGFSAYLPQCLCNPPVWLISDYKNASNYFLSLGINPDTTIPCIFGLPICINIPAVFICLLITIILTRGMKDSTKMATAMVFIKLAVIALFVFAGAFYVKPQNWVPFAPNGFEGVFMGAFIIFFAYIGFDALATAAEECKNPQKDLPIGIIGSLIVTTLVYVSVALVLTGMFNTGSDNIPQEFLKAPMAFLMASHQQNWIAGLISIGSLAGLTSVLLVLQLAATRILYAMSRDNFLPNVFQKIDTKTKVPVLLTWIVGIVCMIGTLTLDLNVAAELCNFGTFTSFIIVCVAVIILRKTEPDRHRPFKVPFSPWFPLIGILCCGGLMIYSMQSLTTSVFLFPIWVGCGILIYINYGYIKNRKAESIQHISESNTETQENAKG